MAYTTQTLRTAGGQRHVIPDPLVSTNWVYKTTDAIATVNTAGYFADGYSKGMQVGDGVRVVTMSALTPAGTVSAVNQATVISITAGAANISNGVAETLTDSD